MIYQSEQVLEEKLIDYLSKNGYEKIEISNEADLINNFRTQVNEFNKEKLKGKELTDNEFKALMNRIEGKSIFDSAKILRDKVEIQREDGSSLYLELIDTKMWCKNIYQITNQITTRKKYESRYDVTLLINGLPLVQIELKRRGKDMKEAFNQIMKYKQHSYPGLFRFIQIFVISNGVDTKYFSNSDGLLNYKYTFFWTDKENNRITSLKEFASTFLERCNISKMIVRYMVLRETEKQLLVLRPYQVHAVEAIIKRAKETNNNGYVWHTTGSGKTLTSFKVSQILAGEEGIDKVFFLVDRRDLDHQTEREFNEFQPGSVDTTESTKQLVDQIDNVLNPIIVTTIQKMSNAVNNEKYKGIMDAYRDKKVIFIIDECHRSQFGRMHRDINKHFKNGQYFGFTGTPRFEKNRSSDGRTTADIFDKCLHHYLIKDAIHDGNVLGFSVTYIDTFGKKAKGLDRKEREKLYVPEIIQNDERITMIVKHIIKYHNQRAKNKGYNALFAVDSIDTLTLYYDKFKEFDHNLNIAAIFSYGDNPDISDGKEHYRDTMDRMIKDYNKLFNTSYSTENENAYRADVDKKVRESKIDILLVVNMFLTGFDSKKLNTLYLDKKLSDHNLIQAYSRTNRLDSEKKPYGNIISFRDLKEETDEALRLFSQTDDVDLLLARSYEEYLVSFISKVAELREIAKTPEEVDEIKSEEGKKEFVIAFRELSKILIRLENFEEFEFTKEVTDLDIQEYEDYKSKYIRIKEEVDKDKSDEDSPLKDIDFALEIIQRDRVNVDYIMNLIGKIDLVNEEKRKEDINYILSELDRADSQELINKVELIRSFLEEIIPKLTEEDSIEHEFLLFQDEMKARTIKNFAEENSLNLEEVEGLVEEYEFSGIIDTEGIQDALTEAEYTFLEIVEKSDEFTEFIREIGEEYR